MVKNFPNDAKYRITE